MLAVAKAEVQRVRAAGMPLRRFDAGIGTSAALMNLLLDGSRLPYLEIGVAAGTTLLQVASDRAVGVDPEPTLEALPPSVSLHRITSDEYFSSGLPGHEGPFHVAFVDGLHLWEAALRDIVSAFGHLRPDGFIVVDDVYPSGMWEGQRASTYSEAVEAAGRSGYTLLSWMGDVWRAIHALAHSGVRDLHWSTLYVAHGRFHTVLWRTPSGTCRSPQEQLNLRHLEAIGSSAPASAPGDLTRSGMAPWYRPTTVANFVRRHRHPRVRRLERLFGIEPSLDRWSRVGRHPSP